jgi:hypothetical protein
MLYHEALVFFFKKNGSEALFGFRSQCDGIFLQINAMPYKTWFRKKSHE